MALGMSVTATTATSASFAFTGLAADGVIDVQISPRPDFQFCIAPIFSIPSAAAYTAPGLNQRGTYYARARIRRASAVVEGTWTPVVGFRTGAGAARDTSPAAVMIEPAMLVVPEPILSYSISGAVAGFPPENLSRDSPVAWRSVVGGGTYVFNVNTAGGPIDTIALLNTNVPEGATIYVRGAMTEAALTNNPPYTSGTVPFRASPNLPQRNGYHCLLRLPALQEYPWWRILISNAVLPGDLLHAEYLVLGRNRMSKNHALEKKETPAALGSIDRRRSGVADRVEGLVMRKVDFTLENMTEAQYETIYADLIYRETLPILCVPNSKPGAFLHDRILFGDFTGSASNPASPRYTRGVSVSSLI